MRPSSWGIVVVLILGGGECLAQSFSALAPDGRPAAVITSGCATSKFFGFSYRLPEEMSPEDLSPMPGGGRDPSGNDFVLFKASRGRRLPDFNRDVLTAAASYRGNTPDPSAASFLRALRHANEEQPDIQGQGEITPLVLNHQQFATLRYQQIRDDGAITYESAYAAAMRGFVVYFVFGSIRSDSLAQMEKSIQTFSMSDHCSAVASKDIFTPPPPR